MSRATAARRPCGLENVAAFVGGSEVACGFLVPSRCYHPTTMQQPSSVLGVRILLRPGCPPRSLTCLTCMDTSPARSPPRGLTHTGRLQPATRIACNLRWSNVHIVTVRGGCPRWSARLLQFSKPECREQSRTLPRWCTWGSHGSTPMHWRVFFAATTLSAASRSKTKCLSHRLPAEWFVPSTCTCAA